MRIVMTVFALLFSLNAQSAQIEETELESKTRDLSRELRPCAVVSISAAHTTGPKARPA